MKKPIFIFVTKSFWAGILPLTLIVLDAVMGGLAVLFSNPELVPPVSTIISHLSGWEVDVVESWLFRFSPLFGYIIAYLRRGEMRPYTLDPKATE